ncbi:DUF308 domain-containing protein [Methanobrevibacter sp.]|uniref:DUF308 domain-containing protein n=1 Tax=Methanobrevibacter sp. TaxID=66852 RepID=UPI00388E3A8D
MNINKSAGYLSIIIGLIFIIFPMFSAGLVSLIVGLSLLFFGITTIYMGINMRREMNNMMPLISIIIGLIAVIFGFLFIFYIDAVSFLVGIQSYIIGFIMIAFGITGIISRASRVSLFSSVFILLMGILAIVLATFALSQPIYVAIIIGIIMIVEGITLLMS